AASAVAIAAALVLVFGAVLGPGKAGTAPLLAGFEARSYRPGQVALLKIGGGTTNAVTLQLFLAGGAAAPRAKARALDGPTCGQRGDATGAATSPEGPVGVGRARPARRDLAERRLRRAPELARSHRLRALHTPPAHARQRAGPRGGADEHVARLRRGGR